MARSSGARQSRQEMLNYRLGFKFSSFRRSLSLRNISYYESPGQRANPRFGDL